MCALPVNGTHKEISLESPPQRLIAGILATEARDNPSRLISIIPKSSRLEDGFREVTFGEFAGAAAHIAKWLSKEFDLTDSGMGEAITYIGVSDIRYSLIFFAIILLRRKLFIISPRNTSSVNLDLLKKVNCTKIVYGSELTELVENYQSNAPDLQIRCLSSVNDLLSVTKESYEYNHKYEDVSSEPSLVVHSSGSTGVPKVVTITNGSYAIYDPVHQLPAPSGRSAWDINSLNFTYIPGETRLHETFPASHVLGLVLKTVVPVYTKTVIVYGLPRPPSAGVTKFILENVKGINAVIMPPSVWEEFAQEEENLPLLDHLEFICYAGGPMSPACGAKMLKHTRINSMYGSSEMGTIHLLHPSPEDWEYIEPNPAAKQEMQLVDKEQDLYELVLPIDYSIRNFSILSHNYPHLKEWRTKDLFRQHPSKPGVWKFYGRNDDILVLSSGEKLFPIQFEQKMLDVPEVSGVVLVGDAQPRTALLIEVKLEAELDEVKQNVEKQLPAANALIADFGRITMQRIIWITGEKRLLRAPKGTVIRRKTEEQFSAEIEEVYKQTAKPSTKFDLRPTAFDKSTIVDLVRSIIGDLSLTSTVEVHDNLFSAGLDSVRTVDLLQQLKAALSGSKPSLDLSWLSLDIIYNNPTVDDLTEILLEFLNHGVLPKQADSTHLVQSTIDRYVKALPQRQVANGKLSSAPVEGYTVAITGSTGFLGSRILRNLLDSPKVTRIINLNRDPNANNKLASIVKNTKKEVNFITVDLAAQDLGIGSTELQRLLQDINQLIHVAWFVDFNATLQAYDSSLTGLVNLIELCSRSTKQAKFFFVSSITSGGLWSTDDTSPTDIPETVIQDISRPGTSGYAQSKFVAENVLASASKVTGTDVSIARVAYLFSSAAERQMTSSASDMIVSLVDTCKAIKCVPNDMLQINWISVTDAASILTELIIHNLETEDHNLKVYNVANPHPLAFADAVPSLQAATNSSRSLGLLEWLHEVQSAQAHLGIEKLPALKIQQMFEQVASRKAERSIDTAQLTAVSSTASNLAPISPETVRGWFESM